MLTATEVLEQIEGDIPTVANEIISNCVHDHFGQPVVEAIEEGLRSGEWRSKRELARILGVSPAEISQIAERIVKMEITKIFSYATRLNAVAEPINQSKIVHAIAEWFLVKFKEIRNAHGENIRLELDYGAVNNIIGLSVECEPSEVPKEFRGLVCDCTALFDALYILTDDVHPVVPMCISAENLRLLKCLRLAMDYNEPIQDQIKRLKKSATDKGDGQAALRE